MITALLIILYLKNKTKVFIYSLGKKQAIKLIDIKNKTNKVLHYEKFNIRNKRSL